MKRVLRIAGMIVATYVVYLGTIYTLQEKMLFPGVEREAPAWQERAGVELWRRDVEGFTVEAIFARHPNATASSPAPLLVFAHGNGGLADDAPGRIDVYHELGFSVLIPEYRGYGRSGGEPGEEAIVDDAVYFVERATRRSEVDGDRVVYHGQSLGGGVAAAVARERPPDALILESTFTSVADFASDFGAPRFLTRHPFDTRDFLKTFEGPVLLMHATDDPVVPYEMGEALSRVARNVRFETFEGRAHMLPPAGEAQRYWTTIKAFATENGIVPGERP